MSKITSKRQVTIPKEVADRCGIEPGDEVRWVPAGSEIRMVLDDAAPRRLDVDARLALFDRATARRDAHLGKVAPNATPPSDRGWTRSELHDRGRAG